MTQADILIIGAGASGLMAAWHAAASPFSVLVAERNATPGRKLAITGKGRCNVTNEAGVQESVLRTPGNGKFLYSAFSKTPNARIVELFESMGVPLALERGGRYFTRSGDARDVVSALARRAEDAGARFMYGARAIAARCSYNEGCKRCFAVRLGGGRLVCADALIVATGGISYPATGSTGDGYGLARSFGHTIVAPRPSLVPLETVEGWPKTLSGLSLRNVGLTLEGAGGGRRFYGQGEMLFAHFGVTGPLVLSGSRHILDDGFYGCKGFIDMKPALSHEKLEARIIRDFAIYARKSLRNAMSDLLPSRLIPVAIWVAGMDGDSPASGVGKRGAMGLAAAMKALPFTVSGSRPVSEAIVTAGGVRVSEVNPSTMESKLAPGLFFCGETLDVDAYTGGFNLSIAFSTGALAARSAAAFLES